MTIQRYTLIYIRESNTTSRLFNKLFKEGLNQGGGQSLLMKAISGLTTINGSGNESLCVCVCFLCKFFEERLHDF